MNGLWCRRIGLFAVMLVVLSSGCGRKDADMNVTCATDAACPSGYHCGPNGVCLGDVACLDDADCCLAQRCEDGVCRRRQMCSEAAPCGGTSQVCVERMCVPRSCVSDAECDPVDRCLVGTCRRKPPCDGRCAAKTACATLLNRCVATTPSAPTCPAGELPVLLNEIALFEEGCGSIPPKITCRKLPTLPAGQYGLVATMAGLGSDVVVLAHDRTYGDLVAAQHDKAPPHERMSFAVLDGVPENAPVVGLVDGPRGGVAEPGPNVGDAIAVAAAGAQLHVLYHDQTHHDLAYLRLKSGLKADRQHVVQSGCGRAIATTVDGAGTPWMAAMCDPADSGAAGPRQVILGRAKQPTPTGNNDWDVTTVVSKTLAASESSPLGPSAMRGYGSHLALGVRGAAATIAAYDPAAGTLVVHRGQPGGSFTARSLPQAAFSGKKHDHGRFPRLVLDGGGRARIACQDVTAGQVLLIEETTPGGVLTVQVLDDGIRKDGHHRVGAGLSLQAMTDGGLFLAYQDTAAAQTIVLRLSGKGKPGTPIALSSTVAGGFSTAVVALTDKSVAVGASTIAFDGSAVASIGFSLAPVVLAAQ